MTDTGLYYALSTIAQCAAALAALIGLFGLWRLDRLRHEAEQIELTLRKILFGEGAPPDIVHIEGDSTLKIAMEVVERGRTPGTQLSPGEWQVKPQLEATLARMAELPGEQRRLMCVLRVFLVVTLGVTLVPAIVGMVHVDELKTWAWTPWLLYGASAWLAGAPVWVVWQAARSRREPAAPK